MIYQSMLPTCRIGACNGSKAVTTDTVVVLSIIHQIKVPAVGSQILLVDKYGMVAHSDKICTNRTTDHVLIQQTPDGDPMLVY